MLADGEKLVEGEILEEADADGLLLPEGDIDVEGLKLLEADELGERDILADDDGLTLDEGEELVLDEGE